MSEPLEPGLSAEADGLNTAAILDRLGELEASNLSLASEVQGLTRVLTVISDLQVEQKVVRERQEEQRLAIKRVQVETEEREQRVRHVVRNLALAAAVLLPVVSLLVYVALIQRVEGLLDDIQDSRVRTCQQGRIAAMGNIDRERRLAAAETDPGVRSIHQQSVVELTRGLVDCEAIARG